MIPYGKKGPLLLKIIASLPSDNVTRMSLYIVRRREAQQIYGYPHLLNATPDVFYWR